MKAAHPFPTMAPEVKVSYNRPKKMIKISSAYECFEVFKKIWDPQLISLQEQMYALFLSRSHNFLCWRLLSTGDGNSVILDRRLLATIALNVKADAVVIAHNHPSGSLKPSRKDLDFTKLLNSTLDLIGIKLTDHLIISDTDYYSIGTELFISEYNKTIVSEDDVKNDKKILTQCMKPGNKRLTNQLIEQMRLYSELAKKYAELNIEYNNLLNNRTDLEKSTKFFNA